MNIFEALVKGNGKATFCGDGQESYVCYDFGKREFIWHGFGMENKLSDQALKYNDWIPYIPGEGKKREETFENVISFRLGFGRPMQNIERLFNKPIKIKLEYEDKDEYI